jgi:hypothetical protein
VTSYPRQKFFWMSVIFTSISFITIAIQRPWRTSLKCLQRDDIVDKGHKRTKRMPLSSLERILLAEAVELHVSLELMNSEKNEDRKPNPLG